MELYVDITTSLRTIRLYKIEYWGVHLGTAVSCGGGLSVVTELHTVEVIDVYKSTWSGSLGVWEVWIMLHTSPGPLHPCSKQF